jgi:integrase
MRTNYALTIEQRNDARRALALLEGRGLTLEACVRLALQLPSAAEEGVRSVPLAGAIGDFLEAVGRRGRRPATVAFYDQALATLEKAWPALDTGGLTVEVCRGWVEADGLERGGRAARWRALRAFLRWGSRQTPALVDRRIAERIHFQWEGPATAEPEFLPVEACEALVRAARPEWAVALALCLFAGLRPWEACRLEWSAVDRAAKLIRVPANVAKTGRARILEDLPPAIWRHLPRRPPSAGRICLLRPDEFTRYVRQSAGIKPWPHDALRHTFASYHVALFNDPGKASLLMGHEGRTTLLHRHYRGLATKAEARKFWAIKAQDSASKK